MYISILHLRLIDVEEPLAVKVFLISISIQISKFIYIISRDETKPKFIYMLMEHTMYLNHIFLRLINNTHLTPVVSGNSIAAGE